MGTYERLKKLRIEKKITQEEMALKLGYKNKSGYCQLENGKVRMTLDKALKISQILGVDIGKIFFDTEVQASRTKQEHKTETVGGKDDVMDEHPK